MCACACACDCMCAYVCDVTVYVCVCCFVCVINCYSVNKYLLIQQILSPLFSSLFCFVPLCDGTLSHSFIPNFHPFTLSLITPTHFLPLLCCSAAIHLCARMLCYVVLPEQISNIMTRCSTLLHYSVCYVLQHVVYRRVV